MQAFIYISIVQVEMKTLVLLILASIAGSWLGAGVVARWPRRKIQLGMGGALLAAALLFVLKNLDAMRGNPMIPGGTALGLGGALLAIGLVGNFTLGALMTLGIGLYAPCLIMISLLGMNPTAAFPIMMGSCAFLMPVASLRFIKAEAFSIRPALGLALGGIPAVLIAAFIVKSLPLVAVRWLPEAYAASGRTAPSGAPGYSIVRLQEAPPRLQTFLDRRRRLLQQSGNLLQRAGDWSRHEDPQSPRTPIQLPGDPRQAEVSGPSFIGQPLDAAIAQAERQVDSEHAVARGKIEEQLSRRESRLAGQRVLDPLQQVGQLGDPFLRRGSYLAGGKIERALVEPPLPE